MLPWVSLGGGHVRGVPCERILTWAFYLRASSARVVVQITIGKSSSELTAQQPRAGHATGIAEIPVTAVIVSGRPGTRCFRSRLKSRSTKLPSDFCPATRKTGACLGPGAKRQKWKTLTRLSSGRTAPCPRRSGACRISPAFKCLTSLHRRYSRK